MQSPLKLQPKSNLCSGSSFLDNLNQPSGIAFYPPGAEPKFVYIANTDSVVRLPYGNGQTKAESRSEKLIELPGGGVLPGGGHWTRDIVFSQSGKKLFVSVGSKSNVSDDAAEKIARVSSNMIPRVETAAFMPQAFVIR